MAFGEAVRAELAERDPARACCAAAFLSGLIRPSGVLQLRRGGELAVQIDLAEPAAARSAFRVVRRLGGEADLLRYQERRFGRRTRVVVRLAGERSVQLMHEVGILSAQLTPLARPPRRLLARRCCRSAYLRGAFAAGGSVAAPRRPAHLELRAAIVPAADVLVAIAAADGIDLRSAPRRSHAIAYSKRLDTIRGLLAHLGAHDAALRLSEADVVARTRASANRATNCDRANLGRASDAAQRQREALAGVDVVSLPPPLREVAELRLAHPDASLAELAARARPPLTKSTVARRLRLLTATHKSLTGSPERG